MKKNLFVLCIISFFCIGALNAQSSEPRSKNFRYKKIKEYEIPDEERRVFNVFGEFSLKNYPDKNLIELNLLEQYEDVRVNKINREYYIFDSIGNIGLANVDGEVVVPPVEGNVRSDGTYIFLGEVTDDFERFYPQFAANANNIVLGNIELSKGLFKAVAKREALVNKFHVIIPYDKYDYISLVPKLSSATLAIHGFCVGKIDKNNNILWGFCDEDGNEIIPCEYTGIFYDGETFTGDNTRKKFEWNDNTFNKEFVNNDSDFIQDDSKTKTYKVGDYYDEDGKQGVVFEVSKDGKHGKIISLDNETLPFNVEELKDCEYKGNNKTGASDLNNGKKNTDKVLAREDAELYLAFLWCREKGDDWYLPSQNELRIIYESKDILNKTIKSKGGDKIPAYYHMSSTEYPYETENKVFTKNFAAVVSMNIGGAHYKGSKNTTAYNVRAVATF